MTPDVFRDLLAQESDAQLVDKCLRPDVVPYVFEPRPAAWDTFRSDMGAALGVAITDITVVGSGRFGLSLKPGKNLKQFTDQSDIDVVVINSGLFDRFWIALLEAAYPREPMAGTVGGWLRERRNEIYTGWLSPLKIKIDHRIFGGRATPVLTLKTEWFNALKSAARHPPRRHADVRGRLYRTVRHAELYHLSSLAALRRSL
jgi:hypothetical protein